MCDPALLSGCPYDLFQDLNWAHPKGSEPCSPFLHSLWFDGFAGEEAQN